MGFGMARNLTKAGVPLAVCDALPAPVRALAGEGASAAPDPAALADRAELIFVCVPSDTEAAEVLFGERGVARSGKAPAIVDTTTMNRGAALRLAQRAAGAGLAYADCPISGMPLRAENGTLTMMFGGSEALFALAQPYLDVMGEFIVHCGAVGAGQLMKAVNNIIYDVNIAAFCEVLPLAIKAGLPPEQLEKVLTTGSSRSFAQRALRAAYPRAPLRGRLPDAGGIQGHREHPGGSGAARRRAAGGRGDGGDLPGRHRHGLRRPAEERDGQGP